MYNQYPLYDNMETIIDKLKKIKELADRGLDGEAVSAKKKLELLLSKHNLTIHDIEGEELVRRHFKYIGSWHKRLVMQTVSSCCNREVDFFRNSFYKSMLLVDLTDLEYAESLNKLDFHLKQFRKEKKKAENAFFAAYIHQHHLFGVSSGEESGEEISHEELMAILSMMEKLEKVSYMKGLKS